MTALSVPFRHGHPAIPFYLSLVEEQGKRSGATDIVDDPVENTKTFAWVLNERAVLLTMVNESLRSAGKPVIDDATFVRKAERMAVGHSDYTTKFALYAFELTR